MRIFLNNFDELSTFYLDLVKCLLVHDYTFNPEHRYVVDVAPTELTDPSYSRIELTGKMRTIDPASGTINFKADNPSFGYLDNVTVSGLILYKELDTDLNSKLLFYWPLPEEQLDGTYAFEINFDPAGIMTFAGV